MSEKLRVVHADVVREDKQPSDQEKHGEDRVPAANMHAAERRENAGAHAKQRQKRYDPPGQDVVAATFPSAPTM